MIQAAFRLVAPEGKLDEFRNVLLHVKGPTESSPECRACWICQDVTNDHALVYLVQWDSQEDLESHLRSVRFRRLLPYIEMSVEPPMVSFGCIEHIRGIEFLVEVLSAEAQQCKREKPS
jgi:quinol monooxygenase YgiN